MVELTLNNDYVKVGGTHTYDILKAINEVCSYEVPSAEWSTKYQLGNWDGKISLFSKKTMCFPAGILPAVTSLLTEIKVEHQVNDARVIPTKVSLSAVDLGPHSFRDYQELGIEKIKSNTRGILAMCTGAGKTKTSCGIISDLSVYPVIFVVPSVSLLKQTVREFNESLKSLDISFGIGEIGGGACDIQTNGVNVATYQTLLTAFDKKYSEQKKKVIDAGEDKVSLQSLEKQRSVLDVDLKHSPEAKKKAILKKIKDVDSKINAKKKMHQNKADLRNLVASCQLLIIDETHIAAEVIECISLKAVKAYYKCGLTGTPQRMDNQDVRMFGATGSVIHRVTSSDLIKRGFLVRPLIYVIDLDFIDKSASTYQETYKKAIVESVPRNELIRDMAVELHAQGRPTIIMVERLAHGEMLQEMIPNSLFVPGSSGEDDKPISDKEFDYRKYQLDRLERNEIILIVTQWAYCGIDAPKISGMILACSIGSTNTIIQQIGRGLRTSSGKSDCVIIDFKHKEKSLRGHFNSRLKAYKQEEEFSLKILKYNSVKETYA